jgi:hypothetical protein
MTAKRTPLLVAGPRMAMGEQRLDNAEVILPAVRAGSWNFRDSYGPVEVTDSDLDRIVDNFKSNARRQDAPMIVKQTAPLNEEHATLPQGADPATYVGPGAVGWLKDLYRENDMLWAKVETNRLGEQLLADDRYRAVSPELLLNWTDPETDQAFGKTLVGLALTTAPRMKGLAHEGKGFLEPGYIAASETATVLRFADQDKADDDGGGADGKPAPKPSAADWGGDDKPDKKAMNARLAMRGARTSLRKAILSGGTNAAKAVDHVGLALDSMDKAWATLPPDHPALQLIDQAEQAIDAGDGNKAIECLEKADQILLGKDPDQAKPNSDQKPQDSSDSSDDSSGSANKADMADAGSPAPALSGFQIQDATWEAVSQLAEQMDEGPRGGRLDKLRMAQLENQHSQLHSAQAAKAAEEGGEEDHTHKTLPMQTLAGLRRHLMKAHGVHMAEVNNPDKKVKVNKDAADTDPDDATASDDQDEDSQGSDAGSASMAEAKADSQKDCPTCKGSGKIMAGNRDCPDCDGSGKLAASETLKFNWDAWDAERAVGGRDHTHTDRNAPKSREALIAHLRQDHGRDKEWSAPQSNDSTKDLADQHQRLHAANKYYANEAAMAEMSGADINDLPDSDFAYIEPGGKKDAQGKTVPRSKRHFPVHDEAHARNALGRAPQSPFGDKAMPKIRAAAKKFEIEVAGAEPVPCDKCSGTGKISNAEGKTEECPRCGGSGQLKTAEALRPHQIQRLLRFAYLAGVHVDRPIANLSVAYAYPQRQKLPLNGKHSVQGSMARFMTVEASEEERDQAWAKLAEAAKGYGLAVPPTWKQLQAAECWQVLMDESVHQDAYQQVVSGLQDLLKQEIDENEPGDLPALIAIWNQLSDWWADEEEEYGGDDSDYLSAPIVIASPYSQPAAPPLPSDDSSPSSLQGGAAASGATSPMSESSATPMKEVTRMSDTKTEPAAGDAPAETTAAPAEPEVKASESPKAEQQEAANFAEALNLLHAAEKRADEYKVKFEGAEARIKALEEVNRTREAAERMAKFSDRVEAAVRSGKITPAYRDKLMEKVAHFSENAEIGETVLASLEALPESHAVTMKELGSGESEATLNESERLVVLAKAHQKKVFTEFGVAPDSITPATVKGQPDKRANTFAEALKIVSKPGYRG